MAEVQGQDFFRKFLDFLNNKTLAVLRPADDILVRCVLNETNATSRISKVFERNVGMFSVPSTFSIFTSSFLTSASIIINVLLE